MLLPRKVRHTACQRESDSRVRMHEGTAKMYVRTWKDIDMVATSDSNPTGSTSNDDPDTAADAEASTAAADPAAEPDPVTEPDPTTGSESTEPPDSARPDSARPAAEAPAESTRSTDPVPDPARRRTRQRRPAVSRDQVMGAVNGVRERLAAIVWIVTVVFAVILAAGALLIALEANPTNDLVEQVTDWAADLDGPFNDLFTFDGDNALKKNALVNWGLAAAAWLVGGKIVSSIIRP